MKTYRHFIAAIIAVCFGLLAARADQPASPIAVAQVCYQFDIPCLIIRALSDKSDENAMTDFERFYQVAARNANRVVLGVLKRMQDAGSEGESYIDKKYGFEFRYPSGFHLKPARDPDGGLLFAMLLDSAGTERVWIDLVDLSDYPREIIAARAATFEAAARFVAELTSGADGPDGSRYCSGVEISRSFKNPYGITTLELKITETVENYNTRQTTTELRSPAFMLDLSPLGGRMILIVEPHRKIEGSEPFLETIVESFKL